MHDSLVHTLGDRLEILSLKVFVSLHVITLLHPTPFNSTSTYIVIKNYSVCLYNPINLQIKTCWEFTELLLGKRITKKTLDYIIRASHFFSNKRKEKGSKIKKKIVSFDFYFNYLIPVLTRFAIYIKKKGWQSN